MEHIYLSRRNIMTLINKLNRAADGGDTWCTIIKTDDNHPKYRQTVRNIAITAVEDDEYYSHREASPVLPEDEPK